MGRLVDGVWRDEWYDTSKTGGSFARTTAVFRDDVTPGGRFAPEAGRYHLVIADACPWCHRVAIARELFGLQDVITMNRVQPLMLEQGWVFAEPDLVLEVATAWQIYTKAAPHYSGRVTVPILWDREHGTIVNNESSELIRMLDGAFRPLHTREQPSWYPEAHREAIDGVNTWVYDQINNGVYKSGFATTQEAYEAAVTELFVALDRAEALMEGREYLVADWPTEADWRLFVTLLRFDAVYHGHFKCNLRRIVDYPNLQAFTERLWNVPGVREVTDMTSIKLHYYGSHKTVNPTGIVAMGPADSPFR
ncbi:MAG: glutathione S-transferase family protein [Myxococcales bacterium]|nr:glutathione S-transferase family protein [Myxococcales bacterium]